MRKSDYYCIIMAGGIGSRFWPLSRNAKPKQFVDALGIGRTFIQMTYDRFARFIPDENFLVVTGVAYKELVLEQLPMLNPEQVLVEAVRRNTAPCVAYATYRLYKTNPEAVVVVTAADHLVLNETRFEEVVCRDLDFAARNDALVTIGITPSYPATGYGYIQVAEGENNDTIQPVIAFREKPDLETAKQFVESRQYSWNSGMFIWSLTSIKKALERYLPDIATRFSEIASCYGTADEQKAVDAAYEVSQSISIDYGVMEVADNVYVSNADFGWSDLGTWGSLYQQLPKDDCENALSGEDILITDSSACLVKELNDGKTVVVDGMEQCLIVDTPDVLMVCKLNDEVKLKKTIDNTVKQRNTKA